jgi:hypothetical protein
VILNNWRDRNDWGEAIYCSSEDAIDVDFWTVVVVERRPSLRLERGRKKRIENVIRGLCRGMRGRGHKQRYDQYTGLIEEVQKGRFFDWAWRSRRARRAIMGNGARNGG